MLVKVLRSPQRRRPRLRHTPSVTSAKTLRATRYAVYMAAVAEFGENDNDRPPEPTDEMLPRYCLVERDPRRAAIDHAPDRRPMALAEGRDAEEVAEAVVAHSPLDFATEMSGASSALMPPT